MTKLKLTLIQKKSCSMLPPPLRFTTIPLTVKAEWLANNIGKPGLKVLDATSHLPTLGRNAKEEHLACRIAGAGWFDIDKIAEKSSKLPHTPYHLPIFSNQKCKHWASKMTIISSSTVTPFSSALHEHGGCCGCLVMTKLVFWTAV